MAVLSQRISLEGGEELRRKFEELGKAGEGAFKAIKDAAKGPIVEPAQFEAGRRAIDGLIQTGSQLARQFLELADNAKKFGTAGEQAGQKTTAALKETEGAAQSAGQAIAAVGRESQTAAQNTAVGLISSANAFRLAAAGLAASITVVTDALAKGASETAVKFKEEAESLKLTITQWAQLRREIADAGKSVGDFKGGVENIVDLFKKAKDGIPQLTKGAVTFKTLSGALVTVAGGAGRVATEADKAATELTKMGASAGSVTTGNVQAALREIAESILAITDKTKQAETGQKIFGDKWREIVGILKAGKPVTDDAKKSIAELGKAHRDLSAVDIEKGVNLKGQWDDLAAAIRATRDQIGALFLDPAISQAKWMTDLVDGSRELFRQWIGLDAVKGKLFVEGLGTTAIETAFKIVVAVSEQLAGLWRDVLVPAGQRLIEIFKQVADAVTGGLGDKVSGEQLAAGFISATIAVTGLVVALKVLGLALAPLTLIGSLFSGFGPIILAVGALVVAFWDKIKEGAQTALEWIPASVEAFQRAFRDLLKGDFAGFWRNFSEAAVLAFQTIVAQLEFTQGVLGDFVRAITGRGVVENSWVGELVAAFRQMGVDLPATIAAVAIAFIGLRKAAQGVARVLSSIFGKTITGDAVIAIALLGSFTGVLGAISGVLGIVAAGFVALTFGIKSGTAAVVFFRTAFAAIVATLAAILTPIGAAVAAITAFATAILLLIKFWPQIKEAAVNAFRDIKKALDDLDAAVLAFLKEKASNAWQWLVDQFNAAVDAIGEEIEKLKAILEWIFNAPGNAWDWIKEKFGQAVEWVLQKIVEAKQNILEWISQGPANAWQWIKDKFNEAVQWVTQTFTEFKNKIVQLTTEAPGNAWQWIKDSLPNAFNEAFNLISSNFTKLLDWIEAKWEAFKHSLGIGAAADPARPAGSVPGFAGGGLLGGRGTGTSDSNLAWVSRGEYITPAKAVRQPGVLAFLELLRRNGGDLRNAIRRIEGFAGGGLVGGAGGLFNDVDRLAYRAIYYVCKLGGDQESLDLVTLFRQILTELQAISTGAAGGEGTLERATISARATPIIGDQVRAAVAKAVDYLSKVGESELVSEFTSRLEGILNKLQGRAAGGLLGGRGTGTSDSNLAWVSRGEYITPARAVSQPGVLAFLEALRRSGGNLRAVLDGMGHFAAGGLARLPSIASAGMSGMNPVTINFPGHPPIVGLRASASVVDELRHAAAMAQVRSGGRKPSRYS